MPAELTLTQGKARAFRQRPGIVVFLLSRYTAHSSALASRSHQADPLQRWSCWAGDGGAAWLQPSCWGDLAVWQAGAMPAGTTLVTAFLFVSTFHMKGQGLAVDSAAHLPRAWEDPSNVLFDPRDHGNEGK